MINSGLVVVRGDGDVPLPNVGRSRLRRDVIVEPTFTAAAAAALVPEVNVTHYYCDCSEKASRIGKSGNAKRTGNCKLQMSTC